MYLIIFKLIFSVLMILGALTPIVPGMRKRAMKVLDDAGAEIVYMVLEFMDGGFENIGQAIIAVIAYLVLMLHIILVGGLLSLVWPLLLFLLITGFIFYKLNKKKDNN
jgi:hypothetical protein